MQKKLAKRLYQKMRYEKIPLFFVQNFLFFVQKIKKHQEKFYKRQYD